MLSSVMWASVSGAGAKSDFGIYHEYRSDIYFWYIL
jgi:hypothetical protein